MPLLEELWEEERDTLALFYLIISYKAINKDIKYPTINITDEQKLLLKKL